MSIFSGRHSAQIDGDFVVFLIGMRINKPWKPHRWLPVFLAMPKMIRELERDPDSGFLGATQGFLTTGPTLVQYWRSFDDLERYARDPGARHLPAWRAFNQKVRGSGDSGSGTRPTECAPASTRPSTETCLESGWRGWPSICRWAQPAPRHAG